MDVEKPWKLRWLAGKSQCLIGISCSFMVEFHPVMWIFQGNQGNLKKVDDSHPKRKNIWWLKHPLENYARQIGFYFQVQVNIKLLKPPARKQEADYITLWIIRTQRLQYQGPWFPRQCWPLSALWIQSPCQMMTGVYNHLLRKVFRFHYHSQTVIGSLGNSKTPQN